ncbi:MAG: hypothetical protein NT124_00615 [Candidatus Dependentiae bacterium]|nr:hypothetical protein [Candidatus Dependentiae bacterium]
MKNIQEGSLFITILIALVLLSSLIGIMLRNAVLFSSVALHKQAYSVQLYAADALLEYGIAHVCNTYDDILDLKPPVALSMPVWPLGKTRTTYAGKINITKKSSALNNSAFVVNATLLEHDTPVQALSCVVTKNTDSSFSVTNWTLDMHKERN